MTSTNQLSEQDVPCNRDSVQDTTREEVLGYPTALVRQQPELWTRLPTELKLMILERAINDCSIRPSVGLTPTYNSREPILVPAMFKQPKFTVDSVSPRWISNTPPSNERVLRQTSKEIVYLLESFNVPLHFRAKFTDGTAKGGIYATLNLTWITLPRALPLPKSIYESLTIDVGLESELLHKLRSGKLRELDDEDFFVCSGYFKSKWQLFEFWNGDELLDENDILIFLLQKFRLHMWKQIAHETFGITEGKVKHLIINVQNFQYPNIDGYGIAWNLEPIFPAWLQPMTAPVRHFFHNPDNLFWKPYIQDAITLRFEDIEFSVKVDYLSSQDFEIVVKKDGKQVDTTSPPGDNGLDTN
ncbi:hypothetical protein BT63DRAFT_418569 [Microthyrium microscopicum]|uniref:Uncharacterized protein n=1 Tax=Microthyrium microscopicum TaxID=703497 RepID=A0A6A6TWW8_9PEZI|nr:hypothetical protein BT63DRAFT_418569 [Microthyrium microscopicum]